MLPLSRLIDRRGLLLVVMAGLAGRMSEAVPPPGAEAPRGELLEFIQDLHLEDAWKRDPAWVKALAEEDPADWFALLQGKSADDPAFLTIRARRAVTHRLKRRPDALAAFLQQSFHGGGVPSKDLWWVYMHLLEDPKWAYMPARILREMAPRLKPAHREALLDVATKYIHHQTIMPLLLADLWREAKPDSRQRALNQLIEYVGSSSPASEPSAESLRPLLGELTKAQRETLVEHVKAKVKVGAPPSRVLLAFGELAAELHDPDARRAYAELIRPRIVEERERERNIKVSVVVNSLPSRKLSALLGRLEGPQKKED